jgi:molybdenum cofactor guanylyltransferase
MGSFHRYEWAITGTSCDEIKKIAETIASFFPDKKIAYIDADHHPAPKESALFHFQHVDAFLQAELLPKEQWEWRVLLNDFDFVLLNGNHFAASKWMVVSNVEKENSVKKRINNPKDIDFILHADTAATAAYLMEWSATFEIPQFHLSHLEGLKKVFWEKLFPYPVRGLIMAGGESARMGYNKATIHYHGKSQLDYLLELFEAAGIETYVSCRPNQAQDLKEKGIPIIEDSISNCGPVGGLISAFRFDPNCAWLSLACDLPHITTEALQQLIQERKDSAIATAFISPKDGMPEPLACIWEPKSFLKLTQYLAFGNTCPRKVLMQNSTHLIQPKHSDWLANANTPSEADEAMRRIKSGKNDI